MPVWSRQSPLEVAVRGACPRCGAGRMFHGLLTAVNNCDEYGLDLRGNDPGDGPGVLAILDLGAAAMALGLWIGFRYRPSTLVHVMLWLPITFFGAVWLLRTMKARLIAQQYMHHRNTLE